MMKTKLFLIALLIFISTGLFSQVERPLRGGSTGDVTTQQLTDTSSSIRNDFPIIDVTQLALDDSTLAIRGDFPIAEVDSARLADTAFAIRSNFPIAEVDSALLADTAAAIRGDFPVADVDSARLADTAAAIRGDFPLPGGGAGITDVTYDQLLTAISAASLTPGGWYKITDYRTVHYYVFDDYTVDTLINVGDLEPLSLLATSDSTLSTLAFSELFPYDIIYYDWDSLNFMNDAFFSVDGNGDSIVNGFKGVIIYRKDTKKNNEFGYDFRNVKFRRFAYNVDNYSTLITYNKGDLVYYIGNKFICTSTVNNNLNHSLDSIKYWLPICYVGVSKYVV